MSSLFHVDNTYTVTSLDTFVDFTTQTQRGGFIEQFSAAVFQDFSLDPNFDACAQLRRRKSRPSLLLRGESQVYCFPPTSPPVTKHISTLRRISGCDYRCRQNPGSSSWRPGCADRVGERGCRVVVVVTVVLLKQIVDSLRV